MWAKNTASVLSRSKYQHELSLLRSFSTASLTKDASTPSSPIADDGRHELWREGQSSDHDNEPRYVISDDVECVLDPPVCPSREQRNKKTLAIAILVVIKLSA